MKKRILSVIMAAALGILAVGCGGAQKNESTPAPETSDTQAEQSASEESAGDEKPAEPEDSEDDFRIGIVTGSFAQSEEDRRGAEAFQEKYGADRVTLAIYPDNFTEEYDVTVQTIVTLSEDPKMKAIIVNQAVEGTTEAFRQIKETRPDILCIAGEAYEDFSDIGEVADLVVSNDFVSRGYLMIRSAHELGCDTFVHISFPRHISYETVARQVAIMKAACDEFGMKFDMVEAPDPTTEVGVPGAQSYILEKTPKWVKKYGQNTAFFCTNDAHTEPLIKELLECGGYFIEADLPSPMLGYPGALDLDFTDDTSDMQQKLEKIEDAIVEKGGAGRFGTWTNSYGATLSAGLAEHAMNVLSGQGELTSIKDMSKSFGAFSPDAEWNGSAYTDAETGEKPGNIFLVYEDTYIMGDPGYYMGSTKVEVPEEYYTIK
ncbi:MAG: DUF3798 domain-containing protein [Lachnospiraceae bacterium]|nr:DUF3798 domain-containing protein [Lachnospiraceae bacterium]